VLLTVALLATGCHTGSRTPPGDVDSESARLSDASLDELSVRVLDHIQSDLTQLYATQEQRMHLSNSLSSVQGEVRQLSQQINGLRKELEDPQAGNSTWRTYVQGQARDLAELNDRLEKVERDLNTNFNDIFNLRKEVRAVVDALDSYRNAYRVSLEERRDALLRELEVLNSVLQPEESSAPSGND